MPVRQQRLRRAAEHDPTEDPPYGPEEAEAELDSCLRAINTEIGVWRQCGRGACRRERRCRRARGCLVPRVAPSADAVEAIMGSVRAEILQALARHVRESDDDAGPSPAAPRPAAPRRAHAAATPRCRSV